MDDEAHGIRGDERRERRRRLVSSGPPGHRLLPRQQMGARIEGPTADALVLHTDRDGRP
jgi:hypothetical protein